MRRTVVDESLEPGVQFVEVPDAVCLLGGLLLAVRVVGFEEGG
jgi:hypothetical protein